MKITNTKQGKVHLIAGGGKIYTDVAARFVASERSIEDVVASPYDKNILKNILSSGHNAVTEFDYFLFAVEGFSRVTETQLVRKRIGSSYVIKSGRAELGGKREFSLVMPDSLKTISVDIPVELSSMSTRWGESLSDTVGQDDTVYLNLESEEILSILERWYSQGLTIGVPEEELRYMKPQGTEFKAIIGMNARALFEFFGERCCMNAQAEIRDMAYKMLRLCKKVAPDLFEDAGAKCKSLMYCPENSRQNKKCSVITKDSAKELLKQLNSK